jgi:mannose-6-phosphate isomerase-like protein (cupin superfamily)
VPYWQEKECKAGIASRVRRCGFSGNWGRLNNAPRHGSGKFRTLKGVVKMRVVRKDDIEEPFLGPFGEKIYEMVGRREELGGTTKHSLAYVVIPAGKYSPAHYHKVSEETYYVLNGKARMIVDGNEFLLKPGQAFLIMPREVHQVFNDEGEIDLEFLALCGPAWDPSDSFDVKGKG